jgi:hypothetical protein
MPKNTEMMGIMSYPFMPIAVLTGAVNTAIPGGEAAGNEKVERHTTTRPRSRRKHLLIVTAWSGVRLQPLVGRSRYAAEKKLITVYNSRRCPIPGTNQSREVYHEKG